MALSDAQKALLEKYQELMQQEMLANNHKGDMASDWDATLYELVAETAYHMAKLNKAVIEVDRGNNEDARKQVEEYAADVGLYMAKIVQTFGVNPPAK